MSATFRAIGLGPDASRRSWARLGVEMPTRTACQDCHRGRAILDGRCSACQSRMWARVKRGSKASAKAPPAPAFDASHLGGELAVKHHGDALALAEAANVAILEGDWRLMRARGCIGSSITNPTPGGRSLAIISNDLRGDDWYFTLLHEIAHVLSNVTATEDECDEFARSFQFTALLAKNLLWPGVRP